MKTLIYACLFAVLAISAQHAEAQTQRVEVTVTSNAPTGGVALTPLWVGFHDGSFDSYNGGTAAAQGIERIAEDGDATLLSSDFLGGYTYVDTTTNTVGRTFSSQLSGRVDGTIGSPSGPPPITPGESSSQIFDIDFSQNQYLSYAAMIIPSNDFLVFNGNPTETDLTSLFNGGGPISFNIGVAGGDVNDAGTEINDFATSAGNPLFGLSGGQTGLNQGLDENGVITNVTSLDPFATFANLPTSDISNFNFNNTALYGNGIATVTISAVSIPEPSSVSLLSLGLAGLVLRRRR